jgi:mannose-6-phosphate isomerase-like protein (cupin superfamily)
VRFSSDIGVDSILTDEERGHYFDRTVSFTQKERSVDPSAGTLSRPRFDASQGPRLVGADDGDFAQLGGCGARFLVWGEESGGGFSLVEHPIPPRSLCAPLHRHAGVDEYSFVLEGRMGALLGDQVIYAEAGELAFKPRDQWHTFWNAGDEPCRILEIISPAGFEHFFREFAAGAQDGSLDVADLSRRYAIDFDMASVARICEEHGLTHPLLEAA